MGQQKRPPIDFGGRFLQHYSSLRLKLKMKFLNMNFAPKELTSSSVQLIFALPFLGLIGYAMLPPKPFTGDAKSLLSSNKWRTPNQTEFLFRADGTWESVIQAPNDSPTFTVFKGTYQVNDRNFFMSKGKRFFRSQRANKGEDAPFVLDRSDTSLGNSHQWLLYNADQSATGEDYQLLSFNATAQQMRTQTQEDNGVDIGVRQTTWTKQP